MALNFRNRNNELSLELLKQSAITPATYSPSNNYLNARSVAVTMNEKPILFIGYEDSQDCIDQAQALASNENFQKIFNYVIGDKFRYGIGFFSNADFFQHGKIYSAVVSSEQGVRDDTGMGAVEAVLCFESNNDNALALAFALCVFNDLMQIIVPTAKPITVIEFEE